MAAVGFAWNKSQQYERLGFSYHVWSDI